MGASEVPGSLAGGVVRRRDTSLLFDAGDAGVATVGERLSLRLVDLGASGLQLLRVRGLRVARAGTLGE